MKEMKKGLVILLTLILALAFAGIIEARTLANIKMTALFYNSTDGTSYSSDFHLKIIDKANDGFDNSDFVLQKLPNGGGYSVFYSNTSAGYNLVIDSYNGTSSRKIKLVHQIVPSGTGIINLSWHVSGKKFKAKLKDYAHDNTYTNPIATMDMMSTSDYSAPQPYSDGLRFFGIDSDNYLIPVFFVPPTQNSGASVSGDSYALRVNMTNASSLSDFVFNWNGTNYSIYDSSSLVFMTNFDNVSSLGENDTHPIDMSFYENNITNNGAIWTSNGKYGGAFNFDGVNDRIKVAEDSSWKASEITVSAWIYGSDTDGEIVNCGYDNASNSYGYRFMKTSDRIWFQFFDGTTSGTKRVQSSSTFDSNWHQVVGTYNGSQMKVYIDGILSNSSSVTGSIAYKSNQPLFIGVWDDSGAGGGDANYNPFGGKIDEVRIWNRSLSADEIKQLYYSNLQKTSDDKWSFYTHEQILTAGVYTYQAHANDYFDGWNSTEQRNVTLTGTEIPIVEFSLPIDFIEFGNITVNHTYVNLTGIRVQNDGNVDINVEINSSDLWQGTHAWPGDNYMFRIGDAGEGGVVQGVFNSSSILSWAQMSASNLFAIYQLNWTNSSDLASMQFNVTVPLDEPAGAKESIIYIIASQA